LPEQERRENDHQPKHHGFNCRIHLETPEKIAPVSKGRNWTTPLNLDASCGNWMKEIANLLILTLLVEKRTDFSP